MVTRYTRPLWLGFLLIGLCLSAQAQNRDWKWAVSGGGLANDGVRKLATDSAGNVYAVGFFYDSADFGATHLVGRGTLDGFVAKINRSGRFLWAAQLGGNGSDDIRDVAVSPNGQVYVVGDYDSRVLRIAGFNVPNTDTSAIPTRDIFIAQLDAQTGAWTGYQHLGGKGDDFGNDIALEDSSLAYITGSFSDTLAIGATRHVSRGKRDAFIGKMNVSTSAWRWFITGGGAEDDQVFAVAAGTDHTLKAAGYFESDTARFPGAVLVNTGNAPFFGADVFALKLDGQTGSIRWSMKAGSIDTDLARDIVLDSAGNAYITGQYSGPAAAFGSFTLANAGGADMYAAKLDDSTGTVLWASQMGGTNYEYGNSLQVDKGNNVWVLGEFLSPSIQAGPFTIPNRASSYDIFLTKINGGNGSFQDALSLGGFELDFGSGLTLDDSGNVFVGGEFYSPILVFNTLTVTNTGSSDMYVAKLSSASITATAPSITAGFKAYPNPAHSYLRVSGLHAGTQAELFNTLGARVLAVSPGTRQEVTLSLQNLPPGLYTLRCGSEARKVVVE